MAPAAPASHDPALAQASPTAAPAGAAPGVLDTAAMQLGNLANLQLDRNQIMALLQNLPGVFGKVGTDKEDAAQILSNLAAAQQQQQAQPPATGQSPFAPPGSYPNVNDPGPSSHPRGPPNLGQLSTVAMQAAPAPGVVGSVPGVGVMQMHPPGRQEVEEGGSEEGEKPVAPAAASAPAPASAPASSGGGRRARGSAAMGSDEWTRQRKDNHKEVERRRRGNINEGINELGRIVPNGSGEKAKGAILARAVQYIHHLKENEARNIEKWTLEKLLMDQAMGDLQTQLEEVRRMWEDERQLRTKAEKELEVLKAGGGKVNGKRAHEDGEGQDDDKRQRTE